MWGFKKQTILSRRNKKMILEGEERTVYYKEGKSIEGVGIIKKVHQLLFDNDYALVTIAFSTGLFKGQEENRIVKI